MGLVEPDEGSTSARVLPIPEHLLRWSRMSDASPPRALGYVECSWQVVCREMQKGHPGLGWPFCEWLSGGDLLSHTVSRAVPSALRGLASGFGMGPGVSPSL